MTSDKNSETLQEQIIRSRSEYRASLLEQIRDGIKKHSLEIPGGQMDGRTVVVRDTLEEILEIVMCETDVPPPSVHAAEVLSPATMFVTAVCPKCGETSGPIMLTVTSVLTVDSDGSEIKLKGKSKARSHICGQLALEMEGDNQTTISDVLGGK